jgi:hypothetical protein
MNKFNTFNRIYLPNLIILFLNIHSFFLIGILLQNNQIKNNVFKYFNSFLSKFS